MRGAASERRPVLEPEYGVGAEHAAQWASARNDHLGVRPRQAVLNAHEVTLIDQRSIRIGNGVEVVNDRSSLRLDVLGAVKVGNALDVTEIARNAVDVIDQFEERHLPFANHAHIAALFEDLARKRRHMGTASDDRDFRKAGLHLPHHLERDRGAIRREGDGVDRRLQRGDLFQVVTEGVLLRDVVKGEIGTVLFAYAARYNRPRLGVACAFPRMGP